VPNYAVSPPRCHVKCVAVYALQTFLLGDFVTVTLSRGWQSSLPFGERPGHFGSALRLTSSHLGDERQVTSLGSRMRQAAIGFDQMRDIEAHFDQD